jgi:two-component system, NtrC family, response regulator AtoC
MEQIAIRAVEDPAPAGFVFGLGTAMQTLNAMAAEIARTDIPVLILGESGTGKDAYARLIHRLSQKTEAPQWKINCAAPDAGHLLIQVDEAFRKLSNHEACESLYLDNVQELDLACQRLLLSHLPDSEGAKPNEGLDARLISSTTRPLENEVEAGRFRRELYFRINGACLRLPPLRERKEDIPALTEHFLNRHAKGLDKKIPLLSNKTLETLVSYHWPGNIRELENLARKMVAFGNVQLVLNDLQASRIASHSPTENGKGSSLKVAARAASKQAERELIMQALDRTRWNRKRAARELQISYKSLLYKIKQIGAVNEGKEG